MCGQSPSTWRQHCRTFSHQTIWWLRNEVLARALEWAWVWPQTWPLAPDFWDALGFSSVFIQLQPAFIALSYESRLSAHFDSTYTKIGMNLGWWPTNSPSWPTRPTGNWPNPMTQHPSLPPGRQSLNPFQALFLNLSNSWMSSQPVPPGSMFPHPEPHGDLVERAWDLT